MGFFTGTIQVHTWIIPFAILSAVGAVINVYRDARGWIYRRRTRRLFDRRGR